MAHVTAVLLSSWRIAQLRQKHSVALYHLRGWSRFFTGTAIAASLACLLIVLFQLNARIATDPLPLVSGNVAPFEWAGEHLQSSLVSAWSASCLCDNIGGLLLLHLSAELLSIDQRASGFHGAA